MALWLGLAFLLPLACGSPEDATPAPAPGEAQSDAGERPLNVVLITLDTARADAFGAYGQTRPVSPNFDRIAQQGVLFEQCATAIPSTLPSHATILTGKLPYAHGIRSNIGYELAAEHTTLAEVLQAAGHATAAEIAAPVIGKRTKLDQGFAHYRDPADFDAKRKREGVVTADGAIEQVESEDRDGSDITKRGLEFISANRDRAFFLWLHYFDPHGFYQPPEPFARQVPDSPYHGEILYTDFLVGRVLGAIEELGLRDRTLVVITSDHGEGLGEHDEGTHSFFVYETTMRVPLVFWGGSIPTGRRVPSLVRTADIAPTILDWLGLPSLPGVQGVSLRPLIEGRSADLRLTGYGESAEPLALFGSTMLRFLRSGDWKYVHKIEPELYDLEADPDELVNLAASQADRVEQMRTDLVRMVGSGASASGARVELSAEEIAKLQALGYLAGETPEGFADAEDLAELRGPDPARMSGDVRRFNRAHTELRARRFDAAADEFRALLARHPQSGPVRVGMIDALAGAERWEELLPLAREQFEENPLELRVVQRLGIALEKNGHIEEAEEHYRNASLALPCDFGLEVKLANLLNRQGRLADQLRALDLALDRCPDSNAVKNDLAYVLATVPDDDLRDGARAVSLAGEVVEATQRRRPDFLDTLACAQAEVGDFDAAQRSMARALELLRNREVPPETMLEFETHAALFEARKSVAAAAAVR